MVGEGDGDAEGEVKVMPIYIIVKPDNELSQCCCFSGLLTARFEALCETQPNIIRIINSLSFLDPYAHNRLNGVYLLSGRGVPTRY